MAPRRMVCGLHGGRRLGAEWRAEATGGWERRASSFPSPTAGVLCQGAGVIISISSASLITSITQLSSVSVESNSFDPMACSTPGLPVHHQLPESTQTLVRRVGDAIQPSHPLSSPLLLPPILPSIRVFSNESALHIRWPNIASDQISRSVVSDSSRPHESQHARPPCPSPTPGVHSDSRPSSP